MIRAITGTTTGTRATTTTIPDYHGDPYSDDGPYDGYYDCRPTKGPRHSDMWCDHYYGRHE